jgi:hypothetical protein
MILTPQHRLICVPGRLIHHRETHFASTPLVHQFLAEVLAPARLLALPLMSRPTTAAPTAPEPAT